MQGGLVQVQECTAAGGFGAEPMLAERGSMSRGTEAGMQPRPLQYLTSSCLIIVCVSVFVFSNIMDVRNTLVHVRGHET